MLNYTTSLIKKSEELNGQSFQQQMLKMTANARPQREREAQTHKEREGGRRRGRERVGKT